MKKYILLAAVLLLATACGSKASTTTSTSTTTTTATSTSSAPLTPVQISEWSIEFTPVQSISDIRYAIDPNHSDTADFSSASLVSLDQQTGGSACATTDAPLGTLSRVVDFSAFTSSGHAAPPSVKIGDYYYYYTQPKDLCSTNQAVQNLQNLQASDLHTALSSLQATPSK